MRDYFEKGKLNLDNLPPSILQFLELNDFVNIIVRLRSNAKSIETLRKSFYQWFDAFKLMKFMHYSRDEFYANIPVLEALKIAQKQLSLQNQKVLSYSLMELREIRKSRI